MPARADLSIYRGDTWVQSIIYRDSEGVAVDFTGASAAMQIRASANHNTALLSLSSADGDIELNADATTGKITVTIDAARTAALKVAGSAVYDLQVTYRPWFNKRATSAHSINIR